MIYAAKFGIAWFGLLRAIWKEYKIFIHLQRPKASNANRVKTSKATMDAFRVEGTKDNRGNKIITLLVESFPFKEKSIMMMIRLSTQE